MYTPFRYLPIVLLIFLAGCQGGNTKETKQEDTMGTTPEPSASAQIGDLPEAYVPQGYAILDSVSGNLNLDSIDDLILVLKKENEEESFDVSDSTEKRPLLILVGLEDGKYRLAAKSNNTVYCYDCGGMMGDPYQQVVIKNGYFSVEHYGGSAWRWTKIVTYKYSKEDEHWFLHRDGGESYHTADPEKVEKTMRTKEDFGKVRFEDFDIYNSGS